MYIDRSEDTCGVAGSTPLVAQHVKAVCKSCLGGTEVGIRLALRSSEGSRKAANTQDSVPFWHFHSPFPARDRGWGWPVPPEPCELESEPGRPSHGGFFLLEAIRFSSCTLHSIPFHIWQSLAALMRAEIRFQTKSKTQRPVPRAIIQGTACDRDGNRLFFLSVCSCVAVPARGLTFPSLGRSSLPPPVVFEIFHCSPQPSVFFPHSQVRL